MKEESSVSSRPDTYSVSYRRTWRRRRYACGYVSKDEAEKCYHRLVSLDYPRVRIEQP